MTAPIPIPSLPPARADEIAAALNRGCRCVTLDEPALARGLAEAVDDPGVLAEIRRDRPHLFSATAVFAAPADIARMQAIIDAVERVVALPAYRERALAWAPPSARFDPGTRGVFLGYDFHLGPDGPKLIEINTNAGGPLLNMLLARASSACCREARDAMAGPAATARLEETFVEMFRAEWRLARGNAPLKTIAIVDDRPAQQYLHPEFRLFETLFRRHGFEAVITDAADLMVCHGNLWHGETRIDLVYNRLTDFALAEPVHTALREAYLNNAVVVTPHPRAHALYADKRNLTLLTDETFLRSLGLPAETIATLLDGIPRTVAVTPAQAEEFWSTRKQWFFKPAAGYGSKAAYRGDKLTKRVFTEILQGDYVAQAQADPGERHAPAVEQALKFDIRNYVYDGRVQLLAARLYQGQTTNFRTAGGGFAPVFCAPATACAG
ncbi:MAG: hypothetical protein EPN55_10555 [Gammaproteobacteria bacterium]|nr:MAG: hypothetical protein EPN55_10555 [Gammaproteobacteria bacterium]